MNKGVATVLAVLLLAACQADVPPVQEGSTKSATPTPITAEEAAEQGLPTEDAEVFGAGAMTVEQMEQAQEEVSTATLAFFDELTAARSDLDHDLNALGELAEPEMLSSISNLILTDRARGLVQKGAPEVTITEVGPETLVNGESQFQVLACSDETSVTYVDAESGEEEVAPGSADFLQYMFTFANRDGWKIIDGKNAPVESCS